MKAHDLAKMLLALPDYEIFYSQKHGEGWLLTKIEGMGVFNGPQIHLYSAPCLNNILEQKP